MYNMCMHVCGCVSPLVKWCSSVPVQAGSFTPDADDLGAVEDEAFTHSVGSFRALPIAARSSPKPEWCTAPSLYAVLLGLCVCITVWGCVVVTDVVKYY